MCFIKLIVLHLFTFGMPKWMFGHKQFLKSQSRVFVPAPPPPHLPYPVATNKTLLSLNPLESAAFVRGAVDSGQMILY